MFSDPRHAQLAYYPEVPQMSYGAAALGLPASADRGKAAPVAFIRGQRKRMNIVPVSIAVFLPWVLFTVVSAAMSFSWHYTDPPLICLIVGLAFLVVVVTGLFAADAAKRRVMSDAQREPTWFFFIFLSCLAAWIMGAIAGDVNFYSNMQPFYDVMNLNMYPTVDPGVMRGQMLMDAGRIVFTQESRLDLKKSMGFKNLDMYCVAPISRANGSRTFETLATYDFWAVGINCCSSNRPDFHCGQFSNPNAHGALRLMQDEQRAFFRLAVQQAEAAYGIKAMHPLFFTWMQDPIAEVNAYQDMGIRSFLVGISSFLVWQLFVVACTCVAFARLGQ